MNQHLLDFVPSIKAQKSKAWNSLEWEHLSIFNFLKRRFS